MKTMRGLLAAGMAVALAFGLGACGNSTSGESDQGKVYFLNYKPEVSDLWKDLAQQYTDETGVDVEVETAASNTYEQQLKSEMAKSNAPTLFQVTGPVGVLNWLDYTADLKNTEIYKNLTLKGGEITSADGNEVLAVPYAIETDGIIYNKDILNKYFAMDGAKATSIDDIDSFAKLKAVADDMQARKDELGIKGAFTSAGMDPSSSWRFTDNLTAVPLYYEFEENGITAPPAEIKGTYLSNYKQLFDLYLIDSTVPRSEVSSKTGDDANSEFSLGEAAFYQNGNWAWTDLQNAGMTADQVGMIPEYMGIPGEETQGQSIGTGNYWCINKKASKADQKATADFLAWLVTSDEAKDALSNDFGFTMPYKAYADVTPSNPLTTTVAGQEKAGKKPTNWNGALMTPSTQWKNDFGNALLEYAQGTGDWDAVKSAFVDGWAKEYQASGLAEKLGQ